MGDEGSRWTEPTRQVLRWAQEAAGPAFLSSEHLLLGLVRQEQGVVPQALTNLGAPPSAIRARLARIIGQGTAPPVPRTTTPALNPPARRALALAGQEADRLHQRAIGPEHLLLGLVGQGDTIAIGVLASLGVTPAHVRAEILRLLDIR